MISMLTAMALGLWSTDDSIATPCSVNANGGYFLCVPWRVFKITICDLKDRASAGLSWEHEVGWKPARVTLDRLIQHPDIDTVEGVPVAPD